MRIDSVPMPLPAGLVDTSFSFIQVGLNALVLSVVMDRVEAVSYTHLSGDQSCVASTRAAYERRRDCLCNGLASIGWKMEKPEGTMFVWAPIPAGFTDSLEFVKALFEKAGVLVTPGSAFGPSGEGHVRMALVQDEDADVYKRQEYSRRTVKLYRSIQISRSSWNP